LPPRLLPSPSPPARKSRLLLPLKPLRKLLKPLSKLLTRLLTLLAMLLLLLLTLLALLLTPLLLRLIRLLRRLTRLPRLRRPRLRLSTKLSGSTEHGRGGPSAALFVCAFCSSGGRRQAAAGSTSPRFSR
jgi:hypothetical protein